MCLYWEPEKLEEVDQIAFLHASCVQCRSFIVFVRMRIWRKGRLKLIRLAYTYMDHRGHTGPAGSPAVPVPVPASVKPQPSGTWTFIASMFRVSQGLWTANVELAAAAFPWPRSASAGTGAKSWPWLKELANVRNSTGPPYLLLGAQPSADRLCLEHAQSGIRLCTPSANWAFIFGKNA